MHYLSRERVREVDRLAVEELGIPSLVLMENAARGIVAVIRDLKPAGRIVILCGHGNNGGDGLAVRRQLAADGDAAECGLVSPGSDLSVDAAANRAMLERSGIAVDEWELTRTMAIVNELTEQDVIVDAMLGTGVRGTVREPFDQIIAAVNASAAAVVAADLPSGMDSDTGEPCGVCVRADRTATFVAAKAGFRNAVAAPWLGEVTVCHIGIPLNWLRERFPEL